MSENNVGILSTPNNNGARLETREDESIRWHGTWKDYISFPSGTIYWNKDDSNSGQICIFANTEERNITESYTNNAGIALNNHLHTVYPGCFSLTATAPNKNRCILMGTPDKQLTWCDKPVIVVDSYVDGSSWYRKYSDGWIEQGGKATIPMEGAAKVTFLINYTESNYTAQATNYDGYLGTSEAPIIVTKATTFVEIDYKSARIENTVLWYTCGY